MFCPCDGLTLGARYPHYHADEPCRCGTCIGDPNYCADDGAFIGSAEKRAMHFDPKYAGLVDDAHKIEAPA